MMLLSQSLECAYDDIHELQVPIVIDVEVRHLTVVVNPGASPTPYPYPPDRVELLSEVR